MKTITISIGKKIFDEILNKKVRVLSKKVNKYWQSELLDIKILNNKIKYDIKEVDYLILTNGLGDDKPFMKVECKKIDFNGKLDQFDFHIGKVVEQKNLTINDDFKDNLIEQLIKEKEQLKTLINKDALTSLYNRRKLEEDLENFMNQRHASSLCAVFVDADRFKGINDNFGHDTGDRVLKFLSLKLQTFVQTRLLGEVYRYGGEEFVILCFETKSSLIDKLNQFREDLKSHRVYHPEKEISITVSMGISFYERGMSADMFLKHADNMVYEAKKNGRDRLEVYNY